MHQFKNIILGYYSKLVHEIDVITEKQLKNYDKSFHDEINLFRKKVLEKVKEAQENRINYLHHQACAHQQWPQSDGRPIQQHAVHQRATLAHAPNGIQGAVNREDQSQGRKQQRHHTRRA